jgi:predicted nucleotidyltransferase
MADRATIPFFMIPYRDTIIMDMRDKGIAALRAWATNNDCALELWLFGSRAKGTSDPDSDIDIALTLMPPSGKTNWALAAYVEAFDDWKAEFRAAVNWSVSLVAIGPKFEMDDTVRDTGIVLWRRD